MSRTRLSAFEQVPRVAAALVRVNRLPATLGYNLAYFSLGVALAWPAVERADLPTLALFALAVLLAKMQASVADAIHDRTVDAANPSKSCIARSVAVLGPRRAWSLLVAELVGAMAAFGVLAFRTGLPVLFVVGAVFILAGFWYSYPPRLKERGVLNHVTTTGVDVCFVVLPVPYLLTGAFPPGTLAVGGMVALYAFAYHLLHQAADAYYDREAGVETFAHALGVPGSVLVAVALFAVAGTVALTLRYYAAAGVLALAVVHCLWVYRQVRGHSVERQSQRLSSLFDIGIMATVLNGAVAVSALRAAGSLPF